MEYMDLGVCCMSPIFQHVAYPRNLPKSCHPFFFFSTSIIDAAIFP